MDILTKNELRNLMEKRDFSCISIYMPTYRTSPEAKQNSIRFKNLLKQMEERLVAGGFRKAEAKALSAPGKDLVKDRMFWQYQSDGFAAFMSSQWFRYYRLPASFEELLVITDRYHIKPLLPLLANDGRFYVLALSQNEVKLFQCSRYSIIEVELENAPKSLSEALNNDDPSKQLQSHGMTGGGKGDRTAIFHGQGAGKDEDKNNIMRFFHQVDQSLQKMLREDPAPLVLAGVDYLLPIYHEASNYSQLMERGIPGNPEALKPEELQKEAWIIVEPHFLKALEDASARYRQLAGSGNASNDIKTIALAAYQGRVDLLFAPVRIQQWGAFDTTTLSIHLHEERAPGDEDLLDFSAVHTLLKGGTVHAVKPEEMPDGARLAAVFRY
jgi:hypothetical protein